MSRTLPSSPSLEELLATDDGLIEMNDAFGKKAETSRPTSPSTNSSAPMATKVTKVVHRNIKMKVDPSTSTTAILPSPSSPGGVGSFIPLPLPSIVPLHHQANHPFIVCPPLSSSTLSSSAPSPSSPSSTSMPTTRQQAPFFVPVSAAGGSPALMDPHILHGHQLSRSASASPVPGSTGDQAKKSADSKKRPRSASTPSGSNSEGSSSAARSKRKRKTPEQLALLEKEFETNPMPNKDVREHLSQNLGLTSRQVQIWFQNKRAKVKNNRVSVPGGSQSPEEASSPEGSPSMNSPLMMDSPSSSSSSTSSSFSLSSSVSSSLSSSYPAPSSPSAFQQFSSIDSFFEPSYFDLLLDAPSYGGNSADFLLQQQTV